MQHHFDVRLAEEYGILEAIILNNMQFWIAKNAANDKNFHDGTYWTYNSVKAFAELFPYVSEKQIRTALKKLVDCGLLQTGNYNKMAYDRTLWYAFTEKGISICPIGKMEMPEKENGFGTKGEPIPYSKPNEKPSNKPNKRFVPPTLEEVTHYCLERRNMVNPAQFINYYTANGWKVGKNPMKDWKAAVRTWEQRDFGGNTKPVKNIPPEEDDLAFLTGDYEIKED